MKTPEAPNRRAVKIGGSLGGNGRLSMVARAVEQAAVTAELVVIPGGGVYADFIRGNGGGEKVAHVQAVLSMAQYGFELVSLIGGAVAVHDKTQTQQAWTGKKIPVFIPYPYILDAHEIPETWEATSDTISLHITRALGLANLVLVKSVDGVMGANGSLMDEVDAGAPVNTGVVDPLFFDGVEKGVTVFIVNGLHPERLKAALAGRGTVGTKVTRP
ncbi:MAG: hypothetical protein HY751_09210 [Nitrospinae bacterium]|nr:hypothetical protein [Nitrospinota bacterium]